MRTALRPLMLTVLAVLAGLSGCSAEAEPPVPSPPIPSPSAPSPSVAAATAAPATSPTRAAPTEVARDPRSHLTTARVTRTPAGLRVEAWWTLRSGRREDQAIAVLEPGAAPRYERWTRRRWFGDDVPTGLPEGVPPSLDGLLANTVPSLAPGVEAFAAGGDGATLAPFQQVARSSDEGATWTTYKVARVDDEAAFVSGEVVLPDGRLLALLDSWTGDRADHPSPQHHGLWASAGDDWSSYAPVGPRFRPVLPTPPGGRLAAWSSLVSLGASPDGGGVVWTTTWDGRVYASVDGARSFRAVRTR